MLTARIYLGDFFEVADRVVGDSAVSAVITDPPYDGDGRFLKYLLPRVRGNIIAFCKPENQYYKADEYLFWTKTPSTKNYQNKVGRFVEIALVLRRGGVFNPLHWSQMTGVYDDRLVYPTEHPYEKPLSLIERLVLIYTNPGDTVIDPFMGSGTTGLACLRNGRNFVGIERDMDYYEIARRRIWGVVDRTKEMINVEELCP